MAEVLLLIGIAVALFVGFNIGGATNWPAFGPAVVSNAISKTGAAALMAVFFLIDAWTIGRRVVETLGVELVTDPGVFTIGTRIVALFLIGGALAAEEPGEPAPEKRRGGAFGYPVGGRSVGARHDRPRDRDAERRSDTVHGRRLPRLRHAVQGMVVIMVGETIQPRWNRPGPSCKYSPASAR